MGKKLVVYVVIQDDGIDGLGWQRFTLVSRILMLSHGACQSRKNWRTYCRKASRLRLVMLRNTSTMTKMICKTKTVNKP